MNESPLARILEDVPPRTLALAGISLSLILILAGVLYGIKPAYTAYQKAESQRERATRNSLDRSRESGPGLASLQKEVESLRRELLGDAGQVPREQIEAFVVGSLDRISQRHGVQLLSIQPSSPSQVWMFEELPYAVSVTGPYFSVHRWLYEVEDELRPMVVKSFEMRPSRNEGRVRLDLRVVAYRARPGADV